MSDLPFIPYARQSTNEDDQTAVASACKSSATGRESFVERFEEALKKYCGVNHAVCFASESSAFQAASFAVNASAVDLLLIPSNSSIATASAQSGGSKVDFIDTDRSNGNLCLESLKEKMHLSRSQGRIITIATHFSGSPVEMEQLQATIIDPKAIVIEDATSAIGSCYKNGERVGSCVESDVTIFSFHWTKIISCGEGGVALTNDSEIATKMRLFRNSGVDQKNPWNFQAEVLTGNFHMTELQAALGISQLVRLDSFVQRRRELINRYASLIKETSNIALLEQEPKEHAAYSHCVVKIDFDQLKKSRETVLKELNKNGIGASIHYLPLYQHPIFKKKNILEKTEDYYSKTLSLPLYSDLTDGDVERIVATLSRIIN